MKKKSLKIRKGYANGTTKDGVVDFASMTAEQQAAYQMAQTQAEKDKIAANAKAAKTGVVLNAIEIPETGGGTKSANYQSQKQTSEAMNSTVQGVATAINPVVGGIISGLTEVGNEARSEIEKTDENGVPVGSQKSIENAAVAGAILNPMDALSYRMASGDWTSTDPKKYYDFMFGDAIKAQRQKSVRAAEDDVNYVNRTALKDGGEVKGKGGPKDDAVPMDLPKGSFVVPAENAPIAEQLRKEVLGESTKKAKSKGDVPVNVSDGEHVFTPAERARMAAAGVDLTKLAPNAEEGNSYANGTLPGGVSGNATTIGGGDAKPSKKYQIGISEEERMAEMTPEELRQYELDKIYGGLSQEEWVAKKQAEKEAALAAAATQKEKEAIQNEYADIFAAAKVVEMTTPATEPKKSGLQKASDAVGGGVGALALGQIAAGLATSLSQKRPKGEIDSTYLGQVADALKDQKTGLGEAEKTAALNKLDLGRKALTNYATSISGGAGTAFAAAKEAAGQEAASVIDLAVADARMKLAKKGRADSLASGLASMKRQLFQDDLSAFQQNQAAAAELTQAGISNFVGNKQYRDAQNRMDERLAKYGTVAFNIPTTTTG